LKQARLSEIDRSRQLGELEQEEAEWEDEVEASLYGRQSAAFKDIANNIWKSSREFDIDISSNEKHSHFDDLVKNNAIQKCLENDTLIFVEGERREE